MKNKKIKGLTLVEVLASIVITVLVMTYGINLFVASWRLSVESAEYDYVLNYISNRIEGLRSFYDSQELISGEQPEQAVLGITNVDITLPSGKTANIKIKVYPDYIDNVIKDKDNHNVAIGIVPVSVIAIWPAKSKPGAPEQYISLTESGEHIEIVSINTYVGNIETFETFR